MNYTVNYITFEKQKITFFKAISAAQIQRKNFKNKNWFLLGLSKFAKLARSVTRTKQTISAAAPAKTSILVNEVSSQNILVNEVSSQNQHSSQRSEQPKPAF